MVIFVGRLAPEVVKGGEDGPVALVVAPGKPLVLEEEEKFVVYVGLHEKEQDSQ